MKPTREELLALERGQELEHDGMTVRRPPLDSRRLIGDELHFKKRYLEGTVTYAMDRLMVEDIAMEPWEFASGEIDRCAARDGAHHRDGTAVVSPW